MSGFLPVAVYTLRVPPGGALIPAVPEAALVFRASMAAIDPDEDPKYEDDANSNSRPRATLKIVRPPAGMDFDESDDEDEDSDNEEVNGGPSDKQKAHKLKQAAALKAMEDALDEDGESGEDEEEDFDLKAAISKLVKGKAPATDEDEDSDESGESLFEETVVCTLSPDGNCQQPLDLTVSENEHIFFKVTGTHSVYLTGNFLMPLDGDHHHDEDEYEEDYDLSPDEDELGIDEDEESDDLDELEDPRITEVESDEEEVPKLIVAKGKNKRTAESDDETGLSDMMAKGVKAKLTNGESGLSKKQQKKLKKNDGQAAATDPKQDSQVTKESKDSKVKSDKKVQFAKNLEQGPTPSSNEKKPAEKTTGTLGIKEIKGVKIDDKKLGSGNAAKAGNTVYMRYIGKLENGKVFDANKKGKPFSFQLGKKEVIAGWDIGIAGMAVGGERRITIPPHLAYGKKSLPGIPANSKLIFDVKLLEIK